MTNTPHAIVSPLGEWHELTITLHRGERGLEGVLTIGGQALDVRGWTREEAGKVKAEVRCQGPDRWLEDWLESLDGWVRAG
jgi:hypothetical protein